jgi:WD40 repeat protein
VDHATETNAMSDNPSPCPKCGSNEIHHRKSRGDWVCDQCEHAWRLNEDSSVQAAPASKPRIFLSYGRDRDGKALADRLCIDLACHGFEVWRDTREITAGQSWQHEITDGLRSAQVVVYLMTPHSTRVGINRDSPDSVDSVCLGEIAYSLFHPPPRPVVPVLAEGGAEPPLAIFHLDYVDLQAWKQSDDQYQAGLRRLLDGIAAALRGERRYRKWHHQLNPWDFAALLNEKRADFCGREWLLDEIDAWRASRQERVLLITGDPGVGKSALVAQLVFLNPGGQVLAYHCCQADTPETLRPARFVRSVAAMLAGKLPAYAARLENEPTVQEALSLSRCEQDPASAFEEGVLAQLEHLPAPADGVRYLLIDALDEALSEPAGGRTIVDLLASRTSRLPGWLRIVATTRKEPAVLDRLRGLRAQTLDAQDPRNRDDLARFLQRRLQSPNLTALLTAASLSAAEAAEGLLNSSAGNFLYLKQVLTGLEQGSIDFTSLDHLPPGLVGMYLRFFERHFPNANVYAGAREVLAVLVAAQEPLTREELAGAVRLGPGDSLGRVLRQLSSFLRELPSPTGAVCLTLYHKSLADWLTDASLEGSLHHVGIEPGHARLAQAGWEAYRQGVSGLSPYMGRHLPLHLTQSRRLDELVAVLTDPLFLEASAEAGNVFDLASALRETAVSLPHDHAARGVVSSLGEAIAWDSSVLSACPGDLFQCLWNRLWWHSRSQLKQFPAQQSDRLPSLLDWREKKRVSSPDSFWLRSLLPSFPALGETRAARFLKLDPQSRTFAYRPESGALALCDRTDEWQLEPIHLWNALTGSPLCPRPASEAVNAAMEPVALSPCGRWVIFVGRCRIVGNLSGYAVDGAVCAWDTTHGTVREFCPCYVDSYSGESTFPVDLAVFPNSRRFACLFHDGTVSVWDIESGARLARTDKAQAGAMNVGFSPDGRRLVLGGWWEDTVEVWDLETGERVLQLPGHRHGVRSVAFSTASRHIVTVGLHAEGGGARVWDGETGLELPLSVEAIEVARPVAEIPGAQWQVTSSWNSAEVRCKTTRKIQARFPVGLKDVISHPSGRIWAGTCGKRICAFALEHFSPRQ